MLALEAWGRDFYKPMVELAHVVALSAEASHELIENARQGRFLSLPEASAISADDWISLFRRPSRVRGALVQVFYAPEQIDNLTEACLNWKILRQEFQQGMREELRERLTKGVTKEERIAWLASLEDDYRDLHLPELRQMLNDDDPTPQQCRNWFGVPEFNFFLTVGMPCWFEFQTTPYHLYQRACRGEFDALESLLRLEPNVDQCERIRDRLFDIRKKSAERYELLDKARLKGCEQPISPADVKFLLGAVLMNVSKQMQRILNGELWIEVCQRLTPIDRQLELKPWIKRIRESAARNRIKCQLKSPDIHRLYDALARDRGLGLVDPDFAGQPDSILRRMNRKAAKLTDLRKPDIRRAA